MGPMPPPKIGLFDSGVGGLTILKEIQALLPNASYVFCMDNAFFPYSEKNSEDLIPRVAELCQNLAQKESLDLLVIACNTASTVCLPKVRETLMIPVVGVVPAIKPAANHSQTKIVGLLATKGTVFRPYTEELIRNFAQDVQMVRVGSTRLVEIAEEKLRGQFVNIDEIRREISPLLECQNLDTIILGCTHFPHILDELRAASEPHSFVWIDPSAAIARRVVQLLPEQAANPGGPRPENVIYSTKEFATNTFLEDYLKKCFGFARSSRPKGL